MATKTDKLQRGEFIEFIKNLILNSEQYKRENEYASYVIALDSPWGTGKSFFLDLLTQSVSDTASTLKIVRYNAWKNDYCENAFEPLLYDILTSDCLSFPMENQTDAKNLQEMISCIGKIGLAMGKQLLFDVAKQRIGIDVKAAFDEVKKTSNPFKNFLLRHSAELGEINSEREAFENFRHYLEEGTSCLKDNNQKLVVIVDELDRCKPTFAIQTLEVVKHLFDTENIVFLFAVDIQQLSHSISSVYGQGFDSVGYLCRFFDYIAKMPEPNVKQYILDNLTNIKTIASMSDISMYHSERQKYFPEILVEFFCRIYSSFDFSLRDLDTVVKSYKIMVDNFLHNYEDVAAHMIYIFFLSLKYKYPKLFSTVFISKSSNTNHEDNGIYQKLKNSFRDNPSIKSAINHLSLKEPLSECSFSDPQRGGSSFRILNLQGNFHVVVAFPSGDNWTERRTTLNISGSNISHILFIPDLEQWENIKNMTYKEFVHKRLEMYNFFSSEAEKE